MSPPRLGLRARGPAALSVVTVVVVVVKLALSSKPASSAVHRALGIIHIASSVTLVWSAITRLAWSELVSTPHKLALKLEIQKSQF